MTATVSLPGATATGRRWPGTEPPACSGPGVMSSAQVARDAYRAMQRGTPFVVHGWRNRVLAFSVRLGPRSVVRAIAAAMNRPAA